MSVPHPFDPQVVADRACAWHQPTVPRTWLDPALSDGTCRAPPACLNTEVIG
jgi:hypothetical protein